MAHPSMSHELLFFFLLEPYHDSCWWDIQSARLLGTKYMVEKSSGAPVASCVMDFIMTGFSDKHRP